MTTSTLALLPSHCRRMPRLPRMAERYFGGLSLEETSEALNVSLTTANASCERRWRG